MVKSDGRRTKDILDLGYNLISCFVQFRVYGTLIARTSDGAFYIYSLHAGSTYTEKASSGYVVVSGTTTISSNITTGVYVDMHSLPILYGHTYNPGIYYGAGTTSGSSLTGTMTVEVYATNKIIDSAL